jgi:hypothetical protein
MEDRLPLGAAVDIRNLLAARQVSDEVLLLGGRRKHRGERDEKHGHRPKSESC